MIQRISKKEAEAWRKKLDYKPQLVWDVLKPQEEQKLWELGEAYKTFLNASKTERETVSELSRQLKRGGFHSVEGNRAGSRVFQIFKDKVLALAV
ncbi:MAG: hypothetical protein EHM75_09150, partial [Desulfobacteraceae bacterium]